MQSKGWLSDIICCSVAMINDLWDGSMDQRKVCGWSLVVVRMAIELKYWNTSYIHTIYIHYTYYGKYYLQLNLNVFLLVFL